MDPENSVVDISSDEELNVSVINQGRKLQWLRDHLFKDDNEEGDSDDVMVVGEVLNSNNSVENALSIYLDGKVRESIDDDDDCVVLEGDPDKIVLVEENQDSGSDDLIVVGEKGEIACRDYPHSRHLCVKYPFSSTLHNCHCEQCHCYVCDIIAPCEFWGTGLSTLDHCHATDKQDGWKTVRKNFKLKQCSSLPATRVLTDTSSSVPFQVQSLTRPIAMPINHVTRSAVLPPLPRPAVCPVPPRPAIRPVLPRPAVRHVLPRPAVRPAPPAPAFRPAPPRHAVHPAPPAPAVRPAPPRHAVSPAPPRHAVSPAPPRHAVRPAPPRHAVRPAPLMPAVRPAPPMPAVRPAPPAPAVHPAHSGPTLPGLSMKSRIFPSAPAIQHRPYNVVAHNLQASDTGAPNMGSGSKSNRFSQSSISQNLPETERYKYYTSQNVRLPSAQKLSPRPAVFKNQVPHKRVNGNSHTNTSGIHSSLAAYLDAKVNQSMKQRVNQSMPK